MLRVALAAAAATQAFHLIDLAVRAAGGHRAFAGNQTAAVSVLEAIRCGE